MFLAALIILPATQFNHIVPQEGRTARTLYEAVSVSPKPQFPDMTGNYQKTVVEPLEAARQVELDKQAAEAQKVAQSAPTPVVGGYKGFIYEHESGNNPLARNAGGCLGLGQACPGSKLLAVCPNLDYACEDQFFTEYMLGRYGSWEAAFYWWCQFRWW